jgi:hypothetical protein
MSDYSVTVGLGGIGATATSGVFNVLDYGATGDGIADDTAEIQAAIDACGAAGAGTVVLPGGLTFLISSQLTVAQNDDEKQIKIQATGAIVEAASGHADDLLTIGSAAARAYNVYVDGGRWQIKSRDWTSTTGINLVNAVYCRVDNVQVWNCAKGIALRGESGKGCVYNIVTNPVIWECQFPIHLSCDNASGWVNANNFYGGLASWSSALDGTDISTSFGVSIDPDVGWQNDPNANVFIGMALEASDAQTGGYEPKAATVIGFHNVFDSFRIENLNSSPFTFPGSTANTGYNRIVAHPASGNYVDNLVADADLNKVQVITDRQMSFNGGAADESVLSLYARSSGYRALDVYESLGANPLFSVYGNGSFTTRPQTAPGSPEQGMHYFNSTYDRPAFYHTTGWEFFQSTGTAEAPADDVTPSVKNIKILRLDDNTGATAITQLDDAFVGQEVTLLGTGTVNVATIANSGNFTLTAAWTATLGYTLTLVTTDGTNWYEIARSDNV